jgi:hypothetical protein
MLSEKEKEEIIQICDKWILKKDFPDLDKLYIELKEVDFSPLIKAFTSRLDTISCKFSKSEQVSGSVCFFGGVITSLLHYGFIEELEGLFTFALCYMLIDHYLDDNTISTEEKRKSMKDIYLFIYKGVKCENNPLIAAAADRYLSLIERVPRCREYILKLFDSELRGVEIQGRTDLPRETYLEIAEEKGGLTAAAIGSIIGLTDEEIENESMKLGALIQYIDDIIDIKDDKNLGIMTLARYDLEESNLDRYIYECMKKITELSNVYNFFKPILMKGLILGVHDNPYSISEDLFCTLSPYDTFSADISKDSINNWFHGKLYSYISEKNI